MIVDRLNTSTRFSFARRGSIRRGAFLLALVWGAVVTAAAQTDGAKLPDADFRSPVSPSIEMEQKAISSPIAMVEQRTGSPPLFPVGQQPGLLLDAVAQWQSASPPSSAISVLPGLPSGAGAVSLSLQQAMQQAIANNLGTRLADERRSEARGRAREALAALLPNLRATVIKAGMTENLAAMGFQKGTFGLQSTFIGPFQTFDARIRAVQSLFNLSAIHRYQAGKTEIEIAELQEKLVRQQVASAAALAYIQILRESLAVEAAQSNLDLARSLAGLAKSQHDAGIATGLDVTRAETRVAQEEVRLAQAHRNADQARLQLLRITGLDLGAEVVPTDALHAATAPPPPVDASLKTAAGGRFEIQLAKKVLRETDLLFRSARSELLPSVDFAGDYGASGVRINENDLPTRSVAIRLNIPVFDGGASWARISEALSRRRQAELSLRDVRTQVEEDVRLALDQIRASGEQVQAAEKSLALAKQELALARDRFSAGVSDNFEVLGAQTALENAREAQVVALAQYNAARANLAAAVGQAENFTW